MDKNSQTIFTVPMQLKKDISIGNLYDFLIADFYWKGRIIQWNNIHNPLVLNINWNKTQELLKLNGYWTIDRDKIEPFIQECKAKILTSLKSYWITFSWVIRDDVIKEELNDLLAQNFPEEWKIDEIYINSCSSCTASFWTDFSVDLCKYCWSKTIKKISREFFQKIDYDILYEKAEKINWMPEYSKSKFLDFLKKMPESYDLTLSKSREFTLSYKDFLLDPRYIAILTILLDKQSVKTNKTTIIHGDVLKKYDYYLLCHLKQDDLPETIVSHWIITDAQRQKVKRSPSSAKWSESWYSHKAIRCILLKNDIFKGIKFDESNMDKQVKEATKYYLKITQMIKPWIIRKDISSLDWRLSEDRKEFIIALNNFRFGKCFVLFTKMVDFLRNITKNTWLNSFEHEILSNLLLLYYWENGNWTQNEFEQ